MQEADQAGEAEVLQGDEGAEASAHTVGERLQAAARQQHLPLLRVPGNGSALGLHSPTLSWFPPNPTPFQLLKQLLVAYVCAPDPIAEVVLSRGFDVVCR